MGRREEWERKQEEAQSKMSRQGTVILSQMPFNLPPLSLPRPSTQQADPWRKACGSASTSDSPRESERNRRSCVSERRRAVPPTPPHATPLASTAPNFSQWPRSRTTAAPRGQSESEDAQGGRGG